MLCPNCRERIDARTLACPRGHRFSASGGVLALLEDDFGRRLARFSDRLSAARGQAGLRLLDAAAYQRLPFGQQSASDRAWQTEWRLRVLDLSVVNGLIPAARPRRVLDVGAWNGWLSNRLALAGHDVTAVDYFADAFDGLRACRHYTARWRSVQMDLRDLSLLDEHFDAIIFNRSLQFCPDPTASLQAARQLLSPGGMLIVTGMQVFRDPRAKAGQVDRTLRQHRQRHGFDLHLFPCKGYLDSGDARQLSARGVRLHRYPRLWLAHLRAALNPEKPLHTYGIWRA